MLDVLDLIHEPGQQIILTPGFEVFDRDERFEQACLTFPESKLEMDADGSIIIMAPCSEDSGFRSGEAFLQLGNWSKKDGTGRVFDSSTVFNLANGAKRSPDAAWVPRDILQREGAATRTITKTRHAPVFVIEVMSPSDRLPSQIAKCREWIANGVQEVMLLHPEEKTAYVFTPGDGLQVFANAAGVASGVLQGFILDCGPIWEDLA